MIRCERATVERSGRVVVEAIELLVPAGQATASPHGSGQQGVAQALRDEAQHFLCVWEVGVPTFFFFLLSPVFSSTPLSPSHNPASRKNWMAPLNSRPNSRISPGVL
jgi:hypothetical protein